MLKIWVDVFDSEDLVAGSKSNSCGTNGFWEEQLGSDAFRLGSTSGLETHLCWSGHRAGGYHNSWNNSSHTYWDAHPPHWGHPTWFASSLFLWAHHSKVFLMMANQAWFSICVLANFKSALVKTVQCFPRKEHMIRRFLWVVWIPCQTSLCDRTSLDWDVQHESRIVQSVSERACSNFGDSICCQSWGPSSWHGDQYNGLGGRGRLWGGCLNFVDLAVTSSFHQLVTVFRRVSSSYHFQVLLKCWVHFWQI